MGPSTQQGQNPTTPRLSETLALAVYEAKWEHTAVTAEIARHRLAQTTYTMPGEKERLEQEQQEWRTEYKRLKEWYLWQVAREVGAP
ncbi:hypothetical protein GMOD_00008187 [Pyrenophora seminiperda CCB06]|uniref:Uncharacterized protein n=1 Tax=Pyrenophora seminiperda CCB06 TaxID=1302712 RepID=A0A3M7M1X2_9PLEO|nr:hypothetical protein GMOD_00008187 [Pyrenophora seminiperda CCB06]